MSSKKKFWRQTLSIKYLTLENRFITFVPNKIYYMVLRYRWRGFFIKLSIDSFCCYSCECIKNLNNYGIGNYVRLIWIFYKLFLYFTSMIYSDELIGRSIVCSKVLREGEKRKYEMIQRFQHYTRTLFVFREK